MTFLNKLKWVLGILIIFILIVATNLIDRNNFVEIRDSVVSIYENRLVAKGLLFDVSRLFHDKEIAVIDSDEVYFIDKYDKANAEINKKLLEFEGTQLTKEEGKALEKLKANNQRVLELETEYIASDYTEKEPLIKQLEEVKQDLGALAKIQLDEGALQMAKSKRALNTVELFTQLEIYILIFLAIVIQIMIIYTPKK